jgi:hypothetical protein
MKFFNIIPLSNFRLECSAYPYDAPSTLVPFHRLYSQYSMHRNQLPRNAFPNIFSLILGILSVALWMFSLLIASLSYLYLVMADIRYACVHGPYSQLLLESSHSHYYRFVPVYRDIVPEHLLSTHDNDILLPKQREHLASLQYESSFENLPYRKFRTFIETKVAAINCGDLTHY